MGLDEIKKGKNVKPPRIVLYGVHGLGKSSFPVGGVDGESMPKPIYIPTEDGLGAIDCESFPLVTTFTEFISRLDDLEGDHDYKTLVIDSADWLEHLIHAEVSREAGVSDIAGIPFGRGYKLAEVKWKGILGRLDELRMDKKMIIILLAHSQVERFNAPEIEAYDRYQIDLHKKSAALVNEWADVVLFANYKTYTTTQDAGFGQKITKAKGTGERVMYTAERPAFNAKNRYSLPFELPFSWAALRAGIQTARGNMADVKEERETKKKTKEKTAFDKDELPATFS